MRAILILWAIPVVLFWGWYGLSAYDLHFGLHFLTREFHDLIFQIYSRMLGLPAEQIPAMIAWVFFVDTLIVFGLAALRWYKHWLPQTYRWVKSRLGFEVKPSEKTRERTLDDGSGVMTPATAQPGPMLPAE